MIELKRNIDCNTIDVYATIAVGRDRPEFLAVALLANDLGTISGEELSRHLLGDIGDKYELGERVLERSVSIGLLEWNDRSADSRRFASVQIERHQPSGVHGFISHRDFNRPAKSARLSESGKKAIEHDKVLISEKGVWRFYYLDDPLIRDMLIHFEHVEVRNAGQERRKLRSGETQPLGSIPTPEFLTRHLGRIFTSVVDGAPFMLQSISQEGENLSSKKLTLNTRITPGRKLDITLQGELRPSSRNGPALQVNHDIDPPKELLSVNYNEVRVELATQGSGVEPRKNGDGNLVVPVPFNERLDTAARNSMRMDIPVSKPDLSDFGLGHFEKTELEGMSVEPDTNEDAQQWARWLLLNGLDDYKTPGLIREVEQKIHGRFSNHQIQPTDPEDLLQEARDSTDKPWSRFLLAPYDLNLWEQE